MVNPRNKPRPTGEAPSCLFLLSTCLTPSVTRLAFIVLQSLEGRPVSVFTPQPLGQPESEESRGASANNFEETKAESGADASESEGEGSGSLLVDTRYGRIMLGAGEKAKRHALAMRQRGQDSASASVDPSAAVGEVEGITSVLDAGGLTSYANVPPSLSAIYRVSNNNRNKPKVCCPTCGLSNVYLLLHLPLYLFCIACAGS